MRFSQSTQQLKEWKGISIIIGKVTLYSLVVWPVSGAILGCIAAILLIRPYATGYTYEFAIDFGIPIGCVFGLVLGLCTSWICLERKLLICLLWLYTGTLAGILISFITLAGPLGFYILAVIGYFIGLLKVLSSASARIAKHSEG